MNQKKIENDTRKRIATFLPDAIAKALTSYHIFADTDIPNEAKGFASHHSACKIAIAHIELLIKLARWADLPDGKAEDKNQQALLAGIMENAEEELRAHKEKNGEQDD